MTRLMSATATRSSRPSAWRRYRFGAALALPILLASGPQVSPQGLFDFLDDIICELDPLYDNCLVKQLRTLTLETDGGMTPGGARDRALVFVFAGFHFDHRSADEKSINLPDPVAYSDRIRSDDLEQVIWVIHVALFDDDFVSANEAVDEIVDREARVLALRYLAEGHLRFGKPSAAIPVLARLRTEIEMLGSPPSQIEPLGTTAWMQALAGDFVGASATIAAIMAIGGSHPIEQLRPIFSQEAAAAVGLTVGLDEGQAMLEEALNELNALSNLPPGFMPETLAIAAKTFGRMGLAERGEEIGALALSMIDEVAEERRVDFLRNLIEAGFDY